MTDKLTAWITHRRARILIVAILLAVALLAAVAGVLWHRSRSRTKGETTPVLVDTSTSDVGGVPGTEIAVAFGGGGGVAEAGGDLLRIALSPGQAEPQIIERVPIAVGEPLSQEEIERILVRLPMLAVDPGDQVELRLPEDLLPPPRPGETIEQPFPPPPDAPPPQQIPSGPLEVLRFAPEGEIPLAPFVNVTFNQPMVPLATLGALSAEEVPVQLEPALPGTWKWLGTKTLSFEHDSAEIDRLPMATEYVVVVPAGTRSATGAVLEETVRWTFHTPPVKIIAHHPSAGPQPLDPLFLIVFDQRVNPEVALDTVQVTADGGAVPIRLATDAEVQADAAANRIVEDAAERRWLAFVAQAPLPADASVVVAIGPGTPSAEGPLLTTEAHRFEFRTYAPLRVERHQCLWDECPPLAPFVIEFNNPIDVEAYAESMLRIEPALPGATVDIVGDTITIRGMTAGRTTYQVKVDAAIRDTFGQTLGTDTQLTFKVGSAEPALFGLDQPLVTLDPASKTPILSAFAINYDRLRVRAYRVEPSDWPAFMNYLRESYRQDNPPEPPGQRVMDETIGLESAPDALTEASIDLSPALEGDLGQLVVVVEPAELQLGSQDRYRRVVQAWVQATQIGLDAFADHGEMVAWATALKDGAPLPGVQIEADAGRQVAVTADDGTARFALPDRDTSLLIARLGDDVAILPKSMYAWDDDAWRPRPAQDELRWYVFDDRAMYRPGEEVHVKGWLRRVGGRQDGDVGLVGEVLQTVHYQVIGSQGNELLRDQAQINALGGFDLSFTLPDNANLGQSQVVLEARGDLGELVGKEHWHSFQVQEFRRPEFEVAARNETTGPYIVDDHAVVAVEAKYYAGGPLPNAEVTWQVSSSPGSYSPPNWPGFVFGRWTPWWFAYQPFYGKEAYGPGWPPYEEVEIETFAGVTDASGNHYLRLDFERADEPQPVSVLAEATVIDVNRQAWAGTTTLLVHPSELYVGLRSERTFVQRGIPLEIEIIVTDLDGSAIPGRAVKVRAARLEWKYRQGAWREEAVDVQDCSVQSAPEPVSCTYETPMGGKYQITATVTDDAGRRNQSQFTRWVSGGQHPPAREVQLEQVTMIPDKETYAPGDVAQVLVQAPFSPAEGLLTVARSGILYTERFSVAEDTVTLRVPIREGHIPNVHLQVELVGAAPRTDDRGEGLENAPPRPAYASGELNLGVPPLRRTLALQVTPRERELEPGGETTMDVLLTDADGRPVPDAELAVVVVDEAILALTGYQLADPVALFYRARDPDVVGVRGRASIVLARPESLAPEGGAYARVEVEKELVVEVEQEVPAAAPAPKEAATDQAQEPPIRMRTDFDPLALFAPTVRTDANGRAQVTVTLPDNLTRYRIMVVAVAGGSQFGSAEANLTARLPLMVRPSAPRFLNFGDRFELPVVLQNQTDAPLTTDVVLRAGNLELTGSPGQRIVVPARDRVEVRFPAMASMPGTARFQVAAVSGSFADAATVELPVYTPATTEAFATYGVVDDGAVAQPVASPEDVYPQFGGLEISTSSTALHALTDAVLYLVAYPFDCSEQLASRVLAIAALRDVLAAFSAEGLPPEDQLESVVQRDVEQLEGLQNGDGGFPVWRRGRDSIPFHTIHVAHALQRAKLKGFDVPQEPQSRALDYLRQIEDHYPSWYGKRTRQTLSAYALYVRDLMGDRDVTKAQRLLDESGLQELSLEAIAWLWQVLVDDPGSADELEAIRRHVTNRAVETAGAANFAASYGDDAYLLLHSDRRTDALLLDALIAGDPQSDLIPKVVNGLLAHRTKERWGNTQENVFVLLALDRYFGVFEAQTPEFVARIWLADTYVGSHEYVGRTTERHETTIPMAYLAGEAARAGLPQDLVLAKEGPGRLYYRLGLRYAPTDLDLDPVDMGFVVQRSYEAMDDPQDVTQDENGAWHMRAGARVRVRLTMVADNRRYHVALVDPLPAGLEIVNPALAVSEDIPEDPNTPEARTGWWWWGPWYEHQNMRDERAEAFASLLWEGVHHYSYVARATTPGRFVAPPAKAEEMYAPEVFGRSSSDLVVVE